MILILDGPNGCGRTTLAKKLAERYGYEYQKDARIEDRDLKGYQRYMKLACTVKQNTVQDRFHWSETVYPVLKKDGRKPLLTWQQQHIERILANRGALIIYCSASDEFIKRTYENRGETFITFEQMPQEKALFAQALSKACMATYSYTPEMGPLNKQVWFANLDVIINQLEKNARKLDGFKSTGIGLFPIERNMKPVMLVGDTCNLKDTERLHEVLSLLPNPWRYYITQARKLLSESLWDSAEILNREVELIVPEVIISFSVESSAILEYIRNRPFYEISDLSYMRSLFFKNKKIKQYAEFIKQCEMHSALPDKMKAFVLAKNGIQVYS